LPILIVSCAQVAAASCIVLASFFFAAVAFIGHAREILGVLVLCGAQALIQLAAQLCQALRKRLAGAADLALFPSLALSDEGVKFLFGGDELAIAFAQKRLGLAAAALAGLLQRVAERLPGIRKQLLNLLKLPAAALSCNRPQPGK
jgi:hypothetical protein